MTSEATSAAIGLILPAATGILPVLTPLAATGLVVVMVLAANTHRRRREPSAIVSYATLADRLGLDVLAGVVLGPLAGLIKNFGTCRHRCV